jgi:hypothetical protein
MSSIKNSNSKVNLINSRIKYGTDGGINVDANTLVVNATTGRVGFNTENPTTLVDISGSMKASSITDFSNSTGSNTQILTKVNGQNLWSYTGYNFSASNMFPYISNNIDVSAIYVGPLITSPAFKYYAGGVLAPNGKIYCIPCHATNVGIIDPNTDTIDTTSISGLSTQQNKYLGGVLAANGKIYCIPDNATNVGIIDPINNRIDTTTISMTTFPDLSAGNKFWGGVLAPDGRIYCSPRGTSYIGIIDPQTNTFNSSLNFTPSGGLTFKYAGGALGSNGNIYFSPFQADKVLRVRPTDNSLNLFGTLGSDFGGGRYYGACTGPDGNVYFPPFHQDGFIHVDVSSETIVVDASFGIQGSNRGTCGGISLGLDGILYGIPGTTSNAIVQNKLFYFNTITKQGGIIPVTYAINGLNDGKWFGAVLAPNGKIYMIPHVYSYVATIKTGVPILQPWMIAPEFNKF